MKVRDSLIQCGPLAHKWLGTPDALRFTRLMLSLYPDSPVGLTFLYLVFLHAD